MICIYDRSAHSPRTVDRCAEFPRSLRSRDRDALLRRFIITVALKPRVDDDIRIKGLKVMLEFRQIPLLGTPFPVAIEPQKIHLPVIRQDLPPGCY